MVAAALVIALPMTAVAAGPESSLVKKTYIYKTVGELGIEADVFRPDDEIERPAVVWMHGGALIVGSRRGVPGNLRNLCRDEGYVLISIDYRLAPEVKLPKIIEDIQDAFRWIRDKGPTLFRVDPTRLVAAGGSAGGYLTMMAGICIDPPPKALLAYWGYGDVDGPWYSQPSLHYRQAVPLIPKEEAYGGVGHGVLTGIDGNTPQRTGRSRFYLYLRQNGLWTKEVSGFDPATERAQLDAYCPVRNITPDYPPILMIHGTDDTDVPYEQSAAMAKELSRHNVPHELIAVPDAGHGLAGGDRTLVGDAHARAMEFVKRHLK
jgi:acetyl esterase/lipase